MSTMRPTLICVQLTLHGIESTWSTECFVDFLYISALDNSVGISGSNLFGGLLDRCTVHSESREESKRITPAGLVNKLGHH